MAYSEGFSTLIHWTSYRCEAAASFIVHAFSKGLNLLALFSEAHRLDMYAVIILEIKQSIVSSELPSLVAFHHRLCAKHFPHSPFH